MAYRRVRAALRGARGAGCVAAETCRYVVDRALPDSGAIPAQGSDITTAWLQGAVGADPGAVRTVRRGRPDRRNGIALVRLLVDGSDLPSSMFIKLAARRLGGRVFMNVMGLGEREARCYLELGSELPVRVPCCYAALVDHRRGRNAILLEDLAVHATFRDITQACSVAEATTVVDALADLHAAYWASPRFDRDLAWLVPSADSPASTLGAALVARVLRRPSGKLADLIPLETQRESRLLLDLAQPIGAYWAAQTRTLTHNDTHLGNLFFEGTTPGFLDWQNVGAGPGIRDVAYFMLPSLEPGVAREAERTLVARYVERIGDVRGAPTEEQAWESYRAAASQYYVGAVVTAAFGERLQRGPIARLGVERAVAAVRDLDTFGLLRKIAAR